MALSILKDILSQRDGMTIGELMNINQERIDKSMTCVPSLEKIYHEVKREGIFDKFKSFFLGKPTLPIYYVIFKISVLNVENDKRSTVIIRLNPDFDLKDWQNNRIKLFCSCPDFKFRSAYTLNKKGSLFTTDKIKTDLGEGITKTPKKTTKTSFLCKHSYAALTWLIQNYSYLMKSI